MEIDRRSFIKVTGAGVVALYLAPGAPAVARSAAPGLLEPSRIPKFVTEMPSPAVLRPHKGTLEMAARRVWQQMLPDGFPTTPVFAYGPRGKGDRHFSTPSATIETEAGRPLRVTWHNELVDRSGRYVPPLLPIDPTLHWANPLRVPDAEGRRSTDNHPSYAGKTYVPPAAFVDGATQYTLYQGPTPISPHLHGGVHVSDESDGYPEAWFLPRAGDLPADAAPYGRWWEFFARKAARLHGTPWALGRVTSTYPNEGDSALLWFHDHTLGMTRINVYSGLAGGYLIRGGTRGDDSVRDLTTGERAILPGGEGDRGPDHGVAERVIVVQDRSFRSDGTLFYPDSRSFFDDYAGEVVPKTDVAPAWNPEFFGDTTVVNGVTWPRVTVRRRRYRWRLLNGTQGRVLFLDLGEIPGVRAHVIGGDSGLLPEPVDVVALGGRLRLAPAERVDLILDLTDVAAGSYVLRNLGPDDPFQGGDRPGIDWDPADRESTGQVLRLDVRGGRVRDITTPGDSLVLPPLTRSAPVARTRRLALMEVESCTEHGPARAALGAVDGDPATGARGVIRPWMDAVTENPGTGECEVWELYNLTADAHPIHLHETAFEVLDRQPIRRLGEDPDEPAFRLDGSARPADPIETGRKDTVLAPPGQVTRIRASFGTPGQFVWHCHMLEHEDNEMMRPFRIGPVQPGQPMDGAGHARPL